MGGPVQLPFSGTWDLTSARGHVYRIQVAWPMQWKKRSGHSNIPVFYLVDGNAMFLTAAEAAWRRATGPHFKGGGIVVAIGYPLTDEVFNLSRRKYDLTPPRDDATTAAYGGARDFLDFIQKTVKPFIANEVFSGSTLGREALFGHSFGGLFSLYALYTQPSLFDCFLSSSPSVWWDGYLISDYEKNFKEGKWVDQSVGSPPQLMISYGTWEQHVPRWSDETEEDYKKRRSQAEEWAMEDNAKALYDRLRDCEFLSGVTLKQYPEEDHGTVIACALSRFLTTFFEEWPISSSP